MTNRLYYADPFCREFDAAIVRIERQDSRILAVLDRTAFYPTSGGQPFDTGRLAAYRVVDVFDDDGGEVVHVLEGAPNASGTSGPGAEVPRVGQTVPGTIDWERRFDHMQQHTGQHVLSAAFERLFADKTVSFHLGAAASTIDLARELSPGDIAAAEAEANRIVWDDRPVTIRYASAEEAAALPLRKESTREGTLRLIEVEGFDLSACGGTHVARTGAIGVIAVGTCERFKGGQRVEFFCGGRALGRFRSMHGTLASAVRLLSVLPEDVPPAIERLQAESRERQRSLAGAHRELARFRAGELAARAEHTDAGQLVVQAVDADADTLKAMAAAITSAGSRFVVALASSARPVLVIVARSQDGSVAANRVIAALTARYGGRGGGRPEMAQAGGLDAPVEEVLQAAREAIRQLSA